MNTMLSNNLKKLRLQKKYTQEYVADALGVSSHTVSRWECNTTLPDVTLLPEIARLYCVSIDDLFKESSVAYENYAQRLASVFESTHNPEDFIRADMEFRKLKDNNSLTVGDMWSYGITHQFMMNYCIENALYWFDKVLANGPTNDQYYWKTRMQKMKLCSQLGKSIDNINEQKIIVKNNPNNVDERCLLLAAYMFANEYEKAYEEFIKSISLFPNEWELYIHGGDICKKLKKYEEAFMNWDKAEKLGTKFMDGKYSKAFCYEELGQYENAYKLWLEIADELCAKGYDVEMKMAKSHAERCLSNIK